jgi:hypothetical protein
MNAILLLVEKPENDPSGAQLIDLKTNGKEIRLR